MILAASAKQRLAAWRSSRCKRTVPPEGTDLVLSSDVPNGERDVLVLDSLDVES